MSTELPVAEKLPEIVAATRMGSVVVTAPPGSGKTTLVPSAILDDLSASAPATILVQPRRLAARAVARWIAHLRNVRLGDEVGYQVRFDNTTTAQTRLFVVTTGVLLRRLQDDPLLEGVGAVVLDEFHERSLEMDVALGMLLRLRESLRPDLRLLVMSATLQADALVQRLGDARLIHAEGRRFPVQVRHLRSVDARSLDTQLQSIVPEMLAATPGHLLVFLPGVGEILRCRDSLEGWAQRHQVELLPLFGDLPPEQQDAVLRPSDRRKVILSTNVAETSLTIEGVTGVIDSGWMRQLRVSPDVGLPRLELTPISQASADQRAGRAGRTAPGVCWRLWEAAAHQARPVAETPEIQRSDLSEVVLQLYLWGERQLDQFPWLTSPPPDALESAIKLLRLLEAIDQDDRVTERGRQLARLPLHPRLATLVIEGAARGVLREASIAAALLSERDPFRMGRHENRGPQNRSTQRSRSDVVDRVLELQRFHAGQTLEDSELTVHAGAARQVLRAAEQFYRMSRQDKGARAADPETALLQTLLAAFPDRVARLRPGSQDRASLVGGRGVKLDVSSRVQGEPLFLAIELNDAVGDARVRLASAIDRADLQGANLREAEELFFNPSRGQVEARRRTYWIDLLLEESPAEITDRAAAAELLAQQAATQIERVLPADDQPATQMLKRIQWLGRVMPDLGLPRFDRDELLVLLRDACEGRRSLDSLKSAPWLDLIHQAIGYDKLPLVDKLAPAKIEVPSGNRITVTYDESNQPVLAVRIQELFGMADTPRIADGRVPVLLHLLGPNYRPQQVTSDLASFWQNTYPTVKKELRRRYPKHAWPDEPQTAAPTRTGLKKHQG